MERAEIIAELKKKFDIRELVCEHTYNKFKDLSWQFLDTELLHTLYVLRFDLFLASITVNNWHNGGSYTQRGLRCNICPLCKDKTMKGEIYLTAHANGAGIDFDVKGYTSEQARIKIKDMQNILPYNIRLEKNVTWVHLDVYDTGQKVFEFNA